ncbi:hypothetical protein niasHT_016808 [Heterodera trifolii]|uniref:BTB domain-containing protein n=1 Tax=Heterodera trifolii TaxID=157864 RepID=A0ABD2KZ08_9BILA
MPKAGIAGLKSILSTGEYSDVHFLVGDGDAKELVPAHKGILKFASDVFEAMFRFEANKEQGENVSANCPTNVEIPDVEAAAFKVMLSFIYTEDLSELNGDNAMAVLYAAKKYNIPDLADASLQIPISELRNVFFAYAQALLFELEKNSLFHPNFIFSALRWANAKCHENGIDCSAENRRAILGPALFKIRFPILSQNEFSEKIVPSGVLTAGEVIGVKKYHNNPNGISEGILYPLPFPSRKRIRTFGIISMDIEKVSQFALEAFGSSRYSEKLYINGFQLEILAQIKMQYRRTYVKWLGIYLLCTASEKDSQWHCRVRSATFRIISQKNGTENFIGIIIDRVFNNKSTKMGLPNFISFEELMDPSNGFYDKSKDKMTLAIDVTTVDGPKKDKLILDQNKSNGTLFMDIEKVSEFAREAIWSERKSKTVYINGLPWEIVAQINHRKEGTDNEKCLSIFLLCSAYNDENWSCKCFGTFRVVSQKSDMADYRKEFNDQLLNNRTPSRGYANVISFAELMDPSKGFYNKSKDKVTLAIDFTVEEAKTEENDNQF